MQWYSGMQIPLNITARDVRLPEGLEDLIRRRVDKLERYAGRDDIIGCRVAVEGPGERHQSGGPYKVRLDISVPGDEIVISNQQAEELRGAVDASFRAAERKVEEWSQLRRGEVKTPSRPPEGPVVGLFRNEGYGFIAADDGRQIYFHENAVLGDGFGELEIGDRVRYAEEQGDEGPQASTVERVDRQGGEGAGESL